MSKRDWEADWAEADAWRAAVKEKCPLVYPYSDFQEFVGVRYGFDCPKGWRGIVEELSVQLQKYLEENPIEGFCCEQVKEKFGGLRYYVGPADETIWDMINVAESKSYKICQDCGAPGETRSGGWTRTVCDECSAEREEEKLGLC